MNLIRNGIGMTSERTRLRMIERLRDRGIQNEQVLQAMFTIPRHVFVEPALESRAYDDAALPLGQGQTISQPHTVARMSELLLASPLKPRKVLEIGTGCGYQTSILSCLVDEVFSVERLGTLLERARANLKALNIRNARLAHADGQAGLIEAAPYDAILVTAASRDVPAALLAQLKPQGRIIMPLGDATQQHLWVIEEIDRQQRRTRYDAVRFVPLLAGRG